MTADLRWSVEVNGEHLVLVMRDAEGTDDGSRVPVDGWSQDVLD